MRIQRRKLYKETFAFWDSVKGNFKLEQNNFLYATFLLYKAVV